MCMPREVANWDSCTELLVDMEIKPNEAETYDDFINRPEKNLYFDREKVIIYRKFHEDRERGDADLAECQGGLNVSLCPFFRVFTTKVAGVDLDDGDCRGR